MSRKESKYNSKEKYLKLKVPLLFTPNNQKKNNNIIKLNIEPKKIYQEMEYNLSKNKIKQKINFGDSKLHLKKNMTQNISALNNIQFNIGKSSQNVLNSKYSKENLKKNSGSAYELLNNIHVNNINMKKKSKNIIKLNNINPLGYLYTSPNEKIDKAISPPPIELNSNIIFLKNEKQIKDFDEEEKKEDINCVLRNSFTNVKIYPTTFLNNKIIFQNNNKENNQSNKSENSNNISSMKHNNSKIKKEKIIIDTENQKAQKEYENFQSMEELHFFFVKTLQTGKIIAKDLDKSNK